MPKNQKKMKKGIKEKIKQILVNWSNDESVCLKDPSNLNLYSDQISELFKQREKELEGAREKQQKLVDNTTLIDNTAAEDNAGKSFQ